MSLTTLERVAAGQADAVEECLRKYSGLVWSLARKSCSNFADAEDAVQEVFVEVWKHAERFDPERASEAAFIATIARRRLIDHYRRRSRRAETTAIDDSIQSSVERPEMQVEAREEAARARRYMARLRPAERQVLELAILEGLTQREIADATDIPLGTVKTNARRGLLRLRELLGRKQALVAGDDSGRV